MAAPADAVAAAAGVPQAPEGLLVCHKQGLPAVHVHQLVPVLRLHLAAAQGHPGGGSLYLLHVLGDNNLVHSSKKLLQRVSAEPTRSCGRLDLRFRRSRSFLGRILLGDGWRSRVLQLWLLSNGGGHLQLFYLEIFSDKFIFFNCL